MANKQVVQGIVSWFNQTLSVYSIPFQFNLVEKKGMHPTLLLMSATSDHQLRKGNYSQITQKLENELQTLLETFVTNPTTVVINCEGVTYETVHNNEIPVLTVAQFMSNALRKPLMVTVGNRYTFKVFPL